MAKGKWTRNQKIAVAALVIPAVIALGVAAYAPYAQVSKYDYSFSNRAGFPQNAVSTNVNGIATINVFVQRHAEGSGTVLVNVWAVNASFFYEGKPNPDNPFAFDKIVTKTDGWSRSEVYVKPDPNADGFTMRLQVLGQDLPSLANPVDPAQITYKKTSPGNYELLK